MIPSLRDIGTAVFELSGWTLGHLLGLVVTAWRPSPTGSLSALILVTVLALGTAGASVGGWKVLAFWLIPTVVVYLHATDLTRMRQRLAAARCAPHPLPEDVGEESVVRSPMLGALHRTARVVALSFGGRWLDAQTESPLVARERLDDDTLRVLDGARAYAALHAGDHVRAAQLALLSLPTGDDAIDRELGVCVLDEAWDDGDRLTAIGRSWSHDEVSLALLDLKDLATARLRAKAGTDPAEGFDRATLRRLASDALQVGDQTLADRLLAASQVLGPYR